MSDRKLPLDKSERILAELLKIPVNTICCDCGAANPKWASFSLGCFLCVRCCSVHRKMGTHISKVKSVSLDSWTQDDIDTMKNWGNGKVNAMYMPHPERHPPPTSMEGSAMEQYIRSKYERKEFMEGGGNHQPSSRSAYGNTFSGGRGSSHNNDIVNTQTYTTQMSALRAMGFTDNAKNLQVLQSTNGDVPNAVEILCRIGSGPVTSSANLTASNSTRQSGNNSSSRANSRSNTSSNSNSNSGSTDPKETILWNMGFHDSAMNKEALRRAGGNPEVAAGILIDEKDKLAKAVRDKASSSPLPARLDPPGSNKAPKNDIDLLLDLSTPEDNNLQQQQQQQRMLQQQMQMQNAFGTSNQQWGNQSSGMDQFGQNQNQLQSILDKNASILALYNNDNQNMNNMNNMNMFGNANNNNMNMNSAFGLQQQQQQPGNMNDMSSWAMNMNNNNNNNMGMNSAFGLQTSMPTGANNMFGSVNSNTMGMGMGMSNTPQHSNPFGQPNQGMGNNSLTPSSPFGTLNSHTTGMSGNSMFGTNNNASMGSGSPMSPFNTLNANNAMNNANNNAFMTGTSQGMNGGMGMAGGMGMGMNNMSHMNNMNNNANPAFGMNQNNTNNNNTNPWGNTNNNNNNNNNSLF